MSDERFSLSRPQIFFQTGEGFFKIVMVLLVGKIGDVIFADFSTKSSPVSEARHSLTRLCILGHCANLGFHFSSRLWREF
jgi:hypothetical protein